MTDPDRPEARSRPCLTLGELAGILLVVAIAAVGMASLVLAQLGHHNGWLAVGVGLGFTALVAAGAVALDGRVTVELDRAEIALLVGTVAAALVFFFPGFRYAYADKDPGVYVAHAFAIARDGNVDIDNPVEAAELPHRKELHQFFSGVNEGRAPDRSTSQFNHYYPALLATAEDLGGDQGVFQLSPLLATVSLALFVLAAKRAAGTAVGAITAALLVTSMMQVWQAKYPSTEIVAQLFISGALLAAVLALERRWATGALVAGLLATGSFLVRPDGFLYILVGVGALALLIAVGHFDRRAAALAAGLAVPLPYAFWNAYVAREQYSAVNDVPSAGLMLLACTGMLGAGAAVALARRNAVVREQVARQADWPALWGRALPLAAVACTGAFAVMLAIFWFRRRLFGESMRYSEVHDRWSENFNVDNLRTLALFVTRPGLALLVAGLAVLLLRRSKLSLYVLVLPGLALLPIYLWDARISMRLMWWVRRFVPAVLPTILLLMALALAWAITHHWRSGWRPAEAASTLLRAAGVVAAVALVATFASHSLPLRDHDELGGSWEASESIASVAGDEEGVFLYGAPAEDDENPVLSPLRNTPAMVWWAFDHVSATLPEDFDMETVEAYAEAFPGQPVFLVLDAEDPFPTSLPAERFELVEETIASIELLEEPTAGPDAFRPETVRSFSWDLDLWQFERT